MPEFVQRVSPAYGFDKSDRHEVFQLLERLEPIERKRWLQWCCKRIERPGLAASIDPKTIGLSREIYLDWIMLCTQMFVDPIETRDELERRVREYGKALAQPAGLILG